MALMRGERCVAIYYLVSIHQDNLHVLACNSGTVLLECLFVLRHIMNTIATVAVAPGFQRPGCCFVPLYKHTERERQG
jgi:hypothetical protein